MSQVLALDCENVSEPLRWFSVCGGRLAELKRVRGERSECFRLLESMGLHQQHSQFLRTSMSGKGPLALLNIEGMPF